MSVTVAPYRHFDGSNCWTENCSRDNARSALSSGSLAAFAAEWFDAVLPQDSSAGPDIKAFQATNRLRRGVNSGGEDRYGEWTHQPQIQALLDRRGELHELLSEDERQALAQYGMYEYDIVNSYLRGEPGWVAGVNDRRRTSYNADLSQDELEERADRILNDLDRAVYKLQAVTKPEKARVLYRYERRPAGWGAQHAAEHFKVGDELEDKAYVSTSMDSDLMLVASNGERLYPKAGAAPTEVVVFEILSSRGATTFPTHGASGIRFAEKEVLLPRNNRFKVHRVTSASFEFSYDHAALRRLSMTDSSHAKVLKKEKLTVLQLIDVTED